MKETFTFSEFLRLCLNKWKWFAVSIATFLLLAIAYLVITPPKYTKKAQILVKHVKQHIPGTDREQKIPIPDPGKIK